VIQITDDEKFFYKDSVKDLDYAYDLARENIKDIIAFGFDIKKTFIFIDTDYMGHMYRNVCKVQKKVTSNQIDHMLGFHDREPGTVNCGMYAYPAIQAVPSFPSTFKIQLGKDYKRFRCLIPCAIDQDPYFRMTRDIADRCGELKTSTFYSKFVPGLGGPKGKMSSSTGASIFLTDTEKQIRKKMKGAFSGGGITKEIHERDGADLTNDTAYQYLKFFLEDDKELEMIAKEYGSGRMSTGEIKKRCCDVIVPLIQNFQRNRSQVTDEMVDAFMTIRRLDMPGYYKPSTDV